MFKKIIDFLVTVFVLKQLWEYIKPKVKSLLSCYQESIKKYCNQKVLDLIISIIEIIKNKFHEILLKLKQLKEKEINDTEVIKKKSF